MDTESFSTQPEQNTKLRPTKLLNHAKRSVRTGILTSSKSCHYDLSWSFILLSHEPLKNLTAADSTFGVGEAFLFMEMYTRNQVISKTELLEENADCSS